MATKTSNKRSLKRVYLDRLQKLADHLDFGELAHVKFYFGAFNSDIDMSLNEIKRPDDKPATIPNCGTCGCAIGECPAIFKQWSFKSFSTGLDSHILYAPTLEGMKPGMVDDSIMEFFGLEHTEVEHLFYPTGQRPDRFGGHYLVRSSTRHEVANNIRAFLYKLKTDPWEA